MDQILFGNIVSTSEAIEQLGFSHYDLVITDPVGSDVRMLCCGRTCLVKDPMITDGGAPMIVYGTHRPQRRRTLNTVLRHGGRSTVRHPHA